MPNIAPALISSKQLNAVTGGFTVTITNPLPVSYTGIGNAGDTLAGGTGSGLVLSCQPDGTLQTRPAGTAAAYESATQQNGLLIYCPIAGGPCFAVPYANGL